jgi:hypothetical protein
MSAGIAGGRAGARQSVPEALLVAELQRGTERPQDDRVSGSLGPEGDLADHGQAVRGGSEVIQLVDHELCDLLSRAGVVLRI